MDGVMIVVLGVGDKVDQYELRQLVFDFDYVFLVVLYDEIIGYVKLVVDVVCIGEWGQCWLYVCF